MQIYLFLLYFSAILDWFFWISELRTLINNQWYQELIWHKFIVTIQIIVGSIGTAIKKKLVQISNQHLQKPLITKCQEYQK